MQVSTVVAVTNNQIPSAVETVGGRPSHHANDSRTLFRNPWNSFRLSGYAEFRDAQSFLWRPSVPSNASNLVPQKKPDWGYTAPSGSLKATWLGHACFLIELPTPTGARRGPRILFDPVFSYRCSPFTWMGPARYTPSPCTVEELPQIDVVAVSHDHYDHMDKATLQKLAFSNNTSTVSLPRVHFFTPLNNDAHLKSIHIPHTHFHCLDWWQSSDITVDLPAEGSATPIRTTFRLTCTPAQHQTGKLLLWSPGEWKTLWSSWALESNPYNNSEGMRNVKVWFAGDTGYRTVHVGEDESSVPVCLAFKEMGDKFGGFDLALLPIAAYKPRPLLSGIHCAPQDSVRIFSDLKAKKAIAMHWGTWHLGSEPVDEPVALLKQECEKAGLKPGEFEPCAIGETIVI